MGSQYLLGRLAAYGLMMSAVLLLPLPVWAFPDTSVLETFTGADDTDPPNANWTAAELRNGIAAPGCRIRSNALAPSATGTHGCYWNGQTFAANSEAYATIVNIGSTAWFGVCVRVTTPGNNTADGYCVEAQDAVSEINIYRLDDSAPTVLGSAVSQTITTTDKIGITAIGDQICLWFSDSGGAWTELACRTDSTYSAAGYIGAYINGSNTVGGMDDFGGGAVSALSQMRRRLVP